MARRRWRRLEIVLALTIVESLGVADATSSSWFSHSYQAYQYDQTLPQFTPDGRLLQVEYAQAAADHSAPILIIPLMADLQHIHMSANENNTDEGTTPHDKTKHEKTILLICTMRSSPRKWQPRLIPIQASHPSSIQQEQLNSGPTCVVAMSGVLADGMAWFQTALLEYDWQRSIAWYGRSLLSATTPAAFARALAGISHSYTLGGGIRPLGATALLAAVTTKTNQKIYKRISHRHETKRGAVVDEESNIGSSPFFLCQADPSGAILMLDPQMPHVIGGGASGRTLLRRIEQQQQQQHRSNGATTTSADDSLMSSSPSLRSHIAQILHDVIQHHYTEQQSPPQLQQSSSSSLSTSNVDLNPDRFSSSSSSSSSDTVDSMSSFVSRPDAVAALDVALLCPERGGVYLMTPNQVQALLNEYPVTNHQFTTTTT